MRNRRSKGTFFWEIASQRGQKLMIPFSYLYLSSRTSKKYPFFSAFANMWTLKNIPLSPRKSERTRVSTDQPNVPRDWSKVTCRVLNYYNIWDLPKIIVHCYCVWINHWQFQFLSIVKTASVLRLVNGVVWCVCPSVNHPSIEALSWNSSTSFKLIQHLFMWIGSV